MRTRERKWTRGDEGVDVVGVVGVVGKSSSGAKVSRLLMLVSGDDGPSSAPRVVADLLSFFEFWR